MKVGVAYNNNTKQFWVNIDIDENSTVIEAIHKSGVLQKCPEIDVENSKIGIFGKMVKTDKILSEGDRVEIYRPITADPLTVHRRDNEEDHDDD